MTPFLNLIDWLFKKFAMWADVPTSVPVFPTLQDDQDDVEAEDQNTPNDEIEALATLMGMLGVAQSKSTDILDSLANMVRPTVRLSYVDTATVRLSTGRIWCKKSDDSQRVHRKNTSTTDLTGADLDTGGPSFANSTTYYVFADADAVATTFAGVISTSATTPSGVTILALIGGFTTDASGNVDEDTLWSEADEHKWPHFLHVRDEKADTTEGGTFTSGAWRTRDLNTVKKNRIAGASLASNQVTLPAGTYFIIARAPSAGNMSPTQAKWYNTTDTDDTIIGRQGEHSGGVNVDLDDWVFGVFTITAEKVFELQHRTTTTVATQGFGNAASFGVGEVYSEVLIWKVI